ncbi:MAG: DUF2254 domain-containing protein [Chloroflexi bacterium]|nr:DUF2254 domain-containing protein [Chloroflexota bacterium]
MLSVLRSLWTYVGIGLLVFYVLLYALLDLPASLQDTASVDPVRTLLGALVTGLITAQALVFTITLVAAQLNARYTHRMVTRVFTWPTALYMGLFIGSSIYSAVVLAALSNRSADFTIHLLALKPIHPASIALALAGTCLALLVPYLWSFRRRLDPEQMALDEGRRAVSRLRRGASTEPREVAALDNIVMSAYGYKDYDTFARGTEQLARVGQEAWRRSRSELGESIFRRIAHIGIATVDDPRAPSQVIDVLYKTGAGLISEGIQEASRQAAAAIYEIGEAAVDKGVDGVARQVGFILSDLGSQAAEQGLVATAEQAAYSLGSLGAKTSQRGLEDSTRQVAVFLRRVGVKAAEQKLDLVTRQALVSVWSLGAHTTRHLPGCAEVVVRELEMLEQIAGSQLVDSSYLSTPGSRELEEFRVRYLQEVRGEQSVGEPEGTGS